jgi:hypothetical protein
MRTSIPSLCNHLRRRTNNQLWFCNACVSFFAIDCERLQIALAYCEKYLYRPSFDPDSFVPEKDLYQAGGANHTSPASIQILPPPPVHRNETIEMIMNWKDSVAITKSDAEVNHLVNNVLLDPNFKVEDLQGFNVAKENRQSDAAEKNLPFLDSFQTASIDIKVLSGVKGVPPATFSVPGLLYRKFTAVIQAAFLSPLAPHFHLTPFKLFHVSPSGEEEWVFSEVYNSDVAHCGTHGPVFHTLV